MKLTGKKVYKQESLQARKFTKKKPYQKEN